MKVSINVSKSITIPRLSLNWLWLAIAARLRFLNRNYDDYDIRAQMDELTPDEARAVVLADIANYDKHMREGLAWSEV